MQTTPIRVLIADDNAEISDILTDFLKLYDDIEVCGVAKNGADALAMIYSREPDIVLLDIIMPELDGLAVLENLKANPPVKRPDIIIASAIAQERITSEAFALGAVYYIVKPFNLASLLNRIRAIAKTDRPVVPRTMTDSSPKNRIKRAVMEAGIQTNVLGFGYIVEAVSILYESERPIPLAKGVYPIVGQKYGTTVECVEKAIRCAISSAEKTGTSYFKRLFSEGGAGTEKSNNSRFLTKICEDVKQYG